MSRREGQLKARDWARCMRSNQTISLLVGIPCPYRFAILGAVLIDKEITESKDYMKLSARLKGQTRDSKLLRILFESRMKQRMALAVPQATVDILKGQID